MVDDVGTEGSRLAGSAGTPASRGLYGVGYLWHFFLDGVSPDHYPTGVSHSERRSMIHKVSLVASLFIALLAGAPVRAAERPATFPAEVPAGTYRNPALHFSMEVPTLEDTSPGPAIFRGPEENGTASVVGVVIQHTQRGAKEYFDSGVKDLRDGGNTVNHETRMQLSGHDALLVDYTAPPKAGRQFRNLILSVVVGREVDLVSCTGTVENFKKHEEEFHKCLQSFSKGETGPATLPSSQAEGFTTFTDTKNKYFLAIPAFDVPAEEVLPVLFRSMERDGSTTSIAVTVDFLKTTRKESIDRTTGLLSLMGVSVRQITSLTVSGYDAAIIDSDQTTGTGKKVRILNLKVFTRDRVYSVLCSTKPEDFAQHEAEFLKCVNTFRVDPAATTRP